MSITEAVVLGIIQGIAEFLPISSSGHLVVAQHFFGIKEGNLAFAVVLHLGTLLSILIAYRAAVWGILREFFLMCADVLRGRGFCMKTSKYRYYIAYILIASIPAGIVGVAFDDWIEAAFGTVYIVMVCFFVSAIILLVGDRVGRDNEGTIERMGPVRAFIVGCFQMVAIMPGITRSGTTLTGGLVCGLQKEEGLELSFLMAVPAILGSLLLEIKDVIEMSQAISLVPIAAGFVASLLFGLASIWLFRAIVQKGSVAVFSFYLMALSCALAILLA